MNAAGETARGASAAMAGPDASTPTPSVADGASRLRLRRDGGDGPRPGGFLALVPAFVYLVTAFYLGSIDQDPLHAVQFEAKDKFLHAFFFGVMQRTHYRALEFLWPRASAARISWSAASSATGVGILLELWQAFLPHRTAELLDVFADAFGAFAFAWIFHRARERTARNRQASNSSPGSR